MGITNTIDSMLLIVDVNNIFYSVRDNYGMSARIDFKKLKEFAISNRSIRFIKAIAHLTHYKDDATGLLQALNKLSYEVKLKPIKQHGDTLVNTDSDIDIAVDCFRFSKSVQMISVVSGDADFISVYQLLREWGIRVEVLSFQSSLAHQIKDQVDEVKYLNENILFMESEK